MKKEILEENISIKKGDASPAALPERSSSSSALVLEVLRFELSTRVEKNPLFSLRAFAKFLGVSHSLLSLVMNGQRAPTKNFVERLADRLCLNPDERQTLLYSLKKSKTPTNTSKSASLKFNKISLDQFALLSEWQHYAILSLLEIPDTALTPEFIAKRLNIPEVLTRVSLQRLFERDLIEKDPATGRWRQSTAPIVVENTESTAHTRKFQRQLLEKALESLDNDPMPLRDLSSTTFAMDPKHVGYALKRIREFRRELTKELEEFGQPQEVYNLCVQLFPTSKRN